MRSQNISDIMLEKLTKTPDFRFLFPDVKDEDIISKKDISCKLPKPITFGGTERAIKEMQFPFNFSGSNVY